MSKVVSIDGHTVVPENEAVPEVVALLANALKDATEGKLRCVAICGFGPASLYVADFAGQGSGMELLGCLDVLHHRMVVAQENPHA